MQEIYIRGFRVKHEDAVREGIKHLMYDLDAEESKVFFDQARLKKSAKFEDDQEGQYTLTYNFDGSYGLIKRDK